MKFKQVWAVGHTKNENSRGQKKKAIVYTVHTPGVLWFKNQPTKQFLQGLNWLK